MNPNTKGTRKDTPAHVQMPSPLRRQIRDMTLQTELEEEKEDQKEKMIKESNGCQSPTTNQEAEKTNKIRKHTPAYVERTAGKKGKQKSISFDEKLLEEDEEKEIIDCAKSLHPIHRKDTPAVLRNPKLGSKARTLTNQDSITEEDEHEDNIDASLMKKSA